MRHFSQTPLLSMLAPLLAVAFLAACGQPDPAPTPSPTPPPTPTPTATPAPDRATLPQDDAPHTGVNTEWWYYNGHLQTEEGDRYGFHYVVFQVTQPDLPQVNIAHLAVTDHQLNTYSTDQRIMAAPLTTLPGPGFAFNLDGWEMSGYDGSDELSAFLNGAYTFDLELTSLKPPALHDGTGLVDFGEAGASYYYSRTRYGVTGAFTVEGESAPVAGLAWFDHQWGNFRPQDIGWDWFALQLDNGSEVMLSIVQDAGGEVVDAYGTYVDAQGAAAYIAAEGFTVEPQGSWTSPETGATYPMGWRVQAPEQGIAVTLEPVIENAEFVAAATTQNAYWEGGVEVTGTHTGHGFVEMTGY